MGQDKESTLTGRRDVRVWNTERKQQNKAAGEGRLEQEDYMKHQVTEEHIGTAGKDPSRC